MSATHEHGRFFTDEGGNTSKSSHTLNFKVHPHSALHKTAAYRMATQVDQQLTAYPRVLKMSATPNCLLSS